MDNVLKICSTMDLSTKPRPFLYLTKMHCKKRILVWFCGTFVGHVRAWDMRAYRITRSDWSHCQFDSHSGKVHYYRTHRSFLINKEYLYFRYEIDDPRIANIVEFSKELNESFANGWVADFIPWFSIYSESVFFTDSKKLLLNCFAYIFKEVRSHLDNFDPGTAVELLFI